jgi:hypothetical protein
MSSLRRLPPSRSCRSAAVLCASCCGFRIVLRKERATPSGRPSAELGRRELGAQAGGYFTYASQDGSTQGLVSIDGPVSLTYAEVIM